MQRTHEAATFARLMVVAIGAALVLLLFTPGVRAAGGPAIVRDINASGSSNPTSLTAVGSTLFFAANDGVHGRELWKSDGTAAGTRMVKNIRPYGKSSWPDNLTDVNGTLFFTANDGKHGTELWKSDGTAAGTKMVKDIRPGPSNQFGGNGILIHERLVPIGNLLFFMEDVCCGDTSDLYVSDGTSTGTYMVAGDDEAITLPDEFSVGTAGGKFYFVNVESSYDGEIYSQIWSSDGTPAGTHPNPKILTPEEISILPAAGSYLYFAVTYHLGLPPAPEHFIWRTDGTAAGTRQLTTLNELKAVPTQAAYMAKRLYFNGGALWRTDSTPRGTKRISDGDLAWLTRAGDRLFFTRGSHLWKSDGTAEGTKDIGVFGKKVPRMLVAVGDDVCFAEFNLDAGTWALWASDGSKTGTHFVRSFVMSDDWSDAVPLGVPIDTKLFLAANDGVHGSELWRYTP